MKYLFPLLLAYNCCITIARGQAPAAPATDTVPQLDMKRFAALGTHTAYDSLHTYLLQQGWMLIGPVDEGKEYAYWYDFNHHRDSTGRRRTDHFISLHVLKATNTIAGIEYRTTSAQQYQDLKRALKQRGFRISIDKKNAYGGETQTYVKEPVWAVLVWSYPQPSTPGYQMTIELLDH